MNDLICKAINDRVLLGFFYRGTMRWVEPHTYGLKKNGGSGLCAWQLVGGSGEAFRLFLEPEMQAFQLGDPFDCEREGYVQGDPQFIRIYAEL
jgi:hypothetical protein